MIPWEPSWNASCVVNISEGQVHDQRPPPKSEKTYLNQLLFKFWDSSDVNSPKLTNLTSTKFNQRQINVWKTCAQFTINLQNAKQFRNTMALMDHSIKTGLESLKIIKIWQSGQKIFLRVQILIWDLATLSNY